MKNTVLKSILNTIAVSVLIISTLTSCNHSGTISTSSVSNSSTTTSSITTSYTTTTSSYPSPGKELKFDTIIESGNIGGPYYKDENAQIVVITSNQTVPTEAIAWTQPEYQNTILSVDYSEYFVLIVFNGYRVSIYSNFRIEQINQEASEVMIIAHFNDTSANTTNLPSSNSQYQVVKISRAQIIQPGLITFKLVDETVKERATVTCEILQ